MREKIKREKGITLIALVVTIVVLLILAGVSISMLTGENGIITQSQSAKEETVISNEKEAISLAYSNSKAENIVNLVENVSDIQLQKELDNNGENTTVTANGNNLEVLFNDTKHKYIINQDGMIDQYNELGNYLVDNTAYFDTLVEAIVSAKDGSTIKVINNVTETNLVTIDKSITLDTNGKTIYYNATNDLSIEDNKNIVIKGNGTFSGNIYAININLEINEVDFMGEIRIQNGNITLNNSIVNEVISSATVVMDGGECNILNSRGGGNFIINNGSINQVSLKTGGNCTINGGQIEEILLSSDSNDINLTIGDINKEVDNKNPTIQNIDIIAPDLVGITSVFNFYNGNIKNCFFNLEDGKVPGGFSVSEYNIRPGYRAETTANGTILVKE